MAGPWPHCPPQTLDICDPDFPGKCLSWTHQLQCDISELIAGSKETLAESRGLMREADRLLALR
jgi:hypothetical protein